MAAMPPAMPPEPTTRSGQAGQPPRLRIAMIGTRGVPARYGGFETAVEEIGARLAARGHDVVVYRRPGSGEDPGPRYRGMRVVTVPAAPVKQAETLSHAMVSMAHQVVRDRADVAVVFNAANGMLLPLLRMARIPVAVNTDGLEWMRGKWGRVGRGYFRMAERATARWADAVIADARGIQSYWRDARGIEARFIPYGAPLIFPADDGGGVGSLGLRRRAYHLVVARFEPENNVDMVLDAVGRGGLRHPVVVVGGTPYPNEVQRGVEAAAATGAVVAPGPVWDQDLLDQLYAGCLTYVHGHSVGGTNPSLLRAMGAGAYVLAFDSPFNHEVLEACGRYFRSAAELRDLLAAAEELDGPTREALAEGARRRVADAYDWDAVADGYLQLCAELAAGGRPAARVRRRRG